MSPVTINELETTLTTDQPTPAPRPGGTLPWEEDDRVRRSLAELERDRARLRAEGFDA